MQATTLSNTKSMHLDLKVEYKLCTIISATRHTVKWFQVRMHLRKTLWFAGIMLHNLTHNGKNKSSANPFDHIWERMHLPNFHCKSATWCVYKQLYSMHDRSHIMSIITWQLKHTKSCSLKIPSKNVFSYFTGSNLKPLKHCIFHFAFTFTFFDFFLHLFQVLLFSILSLLFHFQNYDKRWIFWCGI